MSDLEKLNNDINAVKVEQVADEAVGSVTFEESNKTIAEQKEEGNAKEMYERTKYEAVMEITFTAIMPVNSKLNDMKHCEWIQEWPHLNKILSNFEKDFNNIMMDETLVEVLTLALMYEDYDYVPEECLDKKITEKTVKLIERINQFISKYCDELIKIFNLGLKNNFKDVPEPIKSNFIDNKDEIGDLVNLLGSMKLECKDISESCCSIIKDEGLEIWRDKSTFQSVLGRISDIFKNLEPLDQKFSFKGLHFPHIRHYNTVENGLKIYNVYDVKEIVDNFDDLPENYCMRFETHDFILNFYNDKSVKLVRTDTNEEVTIDFKWCIDGGKLCIVDDKLGVVLDNFPVGGMYMQDYITHINEDLSREIIKFKRNSRRLNLPRLVSIDENSARVLIENFKGERINERINLQSLTSIDVPTAKIFATFSGKIQISLNADTLTEDVAKELIPIKDRLITSAKVVEKIEKVEMKLKYGKELDENLGNLQREIEKTKKRINQKGERGDIEYDRSTNTIKSRGKETEVEKISENSMRLKGLDMDLKLEEGMWLANLKNKVKHIGNEVTFERSIINKKLSFNKTLHIGGKMLITRSDLIDYVPACSNDQVVEKIADWLNK